MRRRIADKDLLQSQQRGGGFLYHVETKAAFPPHFGWQVAAEGREPCPQLEVRHHTDTRPCERAACVGAPSRSDEGRLGRLCTGM